jgi:hypothetical protein
MAKKKTRKLNMRQLEVALRFFDLKPEEVLPEYALEDCKEKRYQWIEDFNVDVGSLGRFSRDNENIKIKISGVYVQQMACGKRGSGRIWQPAKPLRKSFDYTTNASFP